MNNKAFTLSLALAGFAVFFVWSYVSSIEESAKKEYGAKVLVLTASQDIKEMDTIKENMLKLSPIPKRFLDPNAISFETKAEDPETIKSLKHYAGLVAIVPIKKGEQISLNKISEAGIRTGLSPQVTPGKRAVSIPVSETTGVSKLVKPGDRVDIIAIIDPGGRKEQKISRTVLQDAVVLAVGRNVTNNAARTIELDNVNGKSNVRSLVDDFSFASVTLEVDPLQAQMVALLLANGESSLSLSLRNNDDTDRASLPATTFSDVWGGEGTNLRFPAGGR
jgi:pilus assembly protein CpaB